MGNKKGGIDAYERGLRKGRTEGYEYAMNIVLYVMQDKYGWLDDELIRLHNDLEGTNIAIIRGNISFADIKNVLLNEYNIEFCYITKADLKKDKPKPKTKEQMRREMLAELMEKYGNGKGL